MMLSGGETEQFPDGIVAEASDVWISISAMSVPDAAIFRCRRDCILWALSDHYYQFRSCLDLGKSRTVFGDLRRGFPYAEHGTAGIEPASEWAYYGNKSYQAREAVQSC